MHILILNSSRKEMVFLPQVIQTKRRAGHMDIRPLRHLSLLFQGASFFPQQHSVLVWL